MATYFYDRNGATAGFGTLTGNWSDATWSTNGAGTATPGSATFTTADIASFGGTSNTATAGTVTISGTVNLGGIIARNAPLLSGSQTITGGTLNFGSVTGTVTANNGSTSTQVLNLNSAITGTNGLTINGAAVSPGTDAAQVWLRGSLSGLSGTVSFVPSNFTLYFVAPQTSGAQLFNSSTANTLNANSNGLILLYKQTGITGFTINADLTGAQINQQSDVLNETFTITINGLMYGLNWYKLYQGGVTEAKDFPLSVLEFSPNHLSNTISTVFRLSLPAGAPRTAFSNSINLQCESYLLRGARYAILESNGALPVTTTGAIKRTDSQTDTFELTLSGTNTGDNIISGDATVVAGSGTTSLRKTGAGTWRLGGNNSAITGGLTIAGGRIVAGNNNALTSGSVTMSSGPTLDLVNASPTNAINVNGSVRSITGSNTLSNVSTLAGTTTFEAASGASLTISTTSALTGAVALTLAGDGIVTLDRQLTQITSLTKSGSGTATLTNATNSFTGGASISNGTLVTSALAASGSPSPIGAGSTVTFSGTGLLRYTGSPSVTFNRSLTFSSATGAGIENNGSGTLTLTGAVSATNSTIALAGINTGFNRFETAILSGANGFAKSGAGRWIVAGANDITGSSPITGGTLVAANAATNKKLVGSPVVSGGAKLQVAKESDNKGRCTYGSLSMGGVVGTPARMRIGGIATSPTVRMSGNLVLPTSGTVTFDVSGDAFKIPGTYTLIEFASGGVTGGTLAANATAYTGSPYRSAVLSQTGGASGPITVTITKVP